jgi:TRAP-type transport system periplasmic protein
MRDKKLTKLLLSITLLLLGPQMIASASSSTATSVTKPIELIYSSFQPAVGEQSKTLERWQEKIVKETGGRIKFIFYPGATLVSQIEMWDACVSGVADLVHTGRYKPFGGAELTNELGVVTFGIPDVWKARELKQVIFKKYPTLQNPYNELNIIFDTNHTPARILSRLPIRRLDDLKGKLIRAAGKYAAEQLKVLGVSPVTLTPADIYTAIQKGTVDGALGPYEMLVGYTLVDVAKYYTDNLVFYTPASRGHMTAFNWKSWNKLPKDIQEIITASRDWAETELAKAWETDDKKAINGAKSRGGEFNTLPKEDVDRFYRALHQVGLRFAKEADDKGMPGTALYVDVENWKETNISGYKSTLLTERSKMKNN